jgi:phospholipase C
VDILASNPDVFSKTVLFVTYDEEGGFFDHQVPATPPQTNLHGLSTVPTTNEIFRGDNSHPAGPYGLGMRVPMIVVSPWSKGGWVNSQVFDHTSLIRFIEARFRNVYPGLTETNITPWRRAVVGDLTSTLDLSKSNSGRFKLPNTDSFMPTSYVFYPNYNVVPPTSPVLPPQEPGVRPARALPYSLLAHGLIEDSGSNFRIDFVNTGRAAAVFQVRSGSNAHIPRTYTVEPGKSLSDSWPLGAIGVPDCDLSVYGPNGFLRAFKGSVSGLRRAQIDVKTVYDEKGGDINLFVTNPSTQPVNVFLLDKYTGKTATTTINPGATASDHRSLSRESGWYDLVITVDADPTIQYHFAGHVENGKDSISDPGIGVR